jgi:replicative DNA helicase
MTADVIPLDLVRRIAAADESESLVLGACLLHPERIDELGLQPAHFTDPIRAGMWGVMLDLAHRGDTIDPGTVLAGYLAAHGPFRASRAEQFEYVADLTDLTFPRSSTTAHADALRASHTRRIAESVGQRLAETGDVTTALARLADLHADSQARWINTPDRLAERLMRLVSEPPRASIPTGFPDLDRFAGLRPGELTTVLARPGHGKTAFALNVTTNACVPALVFSGEQDADSVLQRIAASVGRIPLQRIRADGLSAEDMPVLQRIAEWLPQSAITIIDQPAPSLDMIEQETRKHVRRSGTQLVVVDYLQRMRTDGTDAAKWEAVGRNIAGLKELARTHEVAVLCLAQAGRGCDAREGDERIPRLDDAQHASAIEQESDVVLGLYRPRGYEPTSADKSATLRVLKNRQGRLGDVRLVYEGQFVRFETPTAAHHAHPHHDAPWSH